MRSFIWFVDFWWQLLVFWLCFRNRLYPSRINVFWSESFISDVASLADFFDFHSIQVLLFLYLPYQVWLFSVNLYNVYLAFFLVFFVIIHIFEDKDRMAAIWKTRVNVFGLWSLLICDWGMRLELNLEFNVNSIPLLVWFVQ